MSDFTCLACGQSDLFRYLPSTNEDGWTCNCGTKPGEPPGFCPQLDRLLLRDKVHDILMQLTNGFGGENAPEFIYVSNGSEGDHLVGVVSAACAKAGMYDQYFIGARLIEACNGGHSDYWKTISDGIMAGEDPRDRCDCGALATSWSNVAAHRCADCREGDLL